MKIQEISLESRYYPNELKNIKKPPKILYAIGNIELLKNKKISIIGSRSNTEYGKLVALNFAKKLSNSGYTVVSGLAEGIDTYAHIGSINEKSKTIAVLPSGFNHIFPKQNKQLYEQIILNKGLVITEYTIETKAEEKNFIERNRIVGGISNGILIVEGDYRSGTTTTAKYARENNVPVFCIPGNINNGKSYTPNLLIKQGDILVTNQNDIINKMQDRMYRPQNREKKFVLEENILEQYNDKIAKKQELKYSKENIREKEILKKYNIYSILTKEPTYINDIVYKSKKDIRQVNYELTMLILEGYVREYPGKQYARIKSNKE